VSVIARYGRFVRRGADIRTSSVSVSVRVNVTGSYPLAELARVQQRGAAGEFYGKVVITPTA